MFRFAYPIFLLALAGYAQWPEPYASGDFNNPLRSNPKHDTYPALDPYNLSEAYDHTSLGKLPDYTPLQPALWDQLFKVSQGLKTPVKQMSSDQYRAIASWIHGWTKQVDLTQTPIRERSQINLQLTRVQRAATQLARAAASNQTQRQGSSAQALLTEVSRLAKLDPSHSHTWRQHTDTIKPPAFAPEDKSTPQRSGRTALRSF